MMICPLRSNMEISGGAFAQEKLKHLHFPLFTIWYRFHNCIFPTIWYYFHNHISLTNWESQSDIVFATIYFSQYDIIFTIIYPSQSDILAKWTLKIENERLPRAKQGGFLIYCSTILLPPDERALAPIGIDILMLMKMIQPILSLWFSQENTNYFTSISTKKTLCIIICYH